MAVSAIPGSAFVNPAFINIPATNALGGVTAPAAGNLAARNVTPIGAEPSVFVQFSDFVRNLLAQQASNPDQDIDEVLAKSLAGLGQSASPTGQLYTANGLLQQYATSLLLSQISSAANEGNQTLNDIAEAARQAALSTELSALNPTNQTDQPSTAINSTTANTPAEVLASETADIDASTEALNADALAVADETTLPAEINAAAQTNVSPANAANTAAVATPPAASTTLQPLSDDFNPYQRAALVSGLTSFGKELNTFVPSSTDLTLDSPIGPVTAIQRIKPRSDVPEDAQASAGA